MIQVFAFLVFLVSTEPGSIHDVATEIISVSTTNGGVASEFDGALPETLPEQLFYMAPESKTRLGDAPYFGFRETGDPVIIIPHGFEWSSDYAKAQVAHELVHYMQALEVKKDLKRRGRAVTVKNLKNEFSEHRNKFERQAKRIETEFAESTTLFLGL